MRRYLAGNSKYSSCHLHSTEMAVSGSPSSSSSGGEEEFLCDYEKERLENIKKNQEMLRMLGN